MQKWTAKMKSTRKTGYGAPGLQESTPTKSQLQQKVNGQSQTLSKSTVKVNPSQQLVNDDVS